MCDEMSIQDRLIFKGERVVVPQASRSELLRLIHNSHLGVNGCLNTAHECLYWPGMTADIKNYVSTCEACRKYERSQVKETMMSPETPNRPWQRVAADLFYFLFYFINFASQGCRAPQQLAPITVAPFFTLPTMIHNTGNYVPYS